MKSSQFFYLSSVMTQFKKRRFWMNIVFRKSGILESNLWLKIKLIFLFILGQKILQALSILFNRMEGLGSWRPSILTLVLKVVKIITSTEKDFLFDFFCIFWIGRDFWMPMKFNGWSTGNILEIQTLVSKIKNSKI